METKRKESQVKKRMHSPGLKNRLLFPDISAQKSRNPIVSQFPQQHITEPNPQKKKKRIKRKKLLQTVKGILQCMNRSLKRGKINRMN